jgi:hypothetical protein
MNEKNDVTHEESRELCACGSGGRLPCDGECRKLWRTRSDGTKCGACYTEADLVVNKPRAGRPRG